MSCGIRKCRLPVICPLKTTTIYTLLADDSFPTDKMRFIHFLRPFTVLPAVFGLRVSSMDEQQVLGFSNMEREAMSCE
jgi:hypothetical protein